MISAQVVNAHTFSWEIEYYHTGKRHNITSTPVTTVNTAWNIPVYLIQSVYWCWCIGILVPALVLYVCDTALLWVGCGGAFDNGLTRKWNK